ncbi:MULTISPECIES: hypothetical protein [unclassified Polaromonas]|uniref:hypothetical protein n=1 Tax=unclassified Polaromonas TaxID=2638319 RepID=UPI0018CBAE7B|nr:MULTISPECIES: hypothetical protein [unclassified Polaromonas]MBG6071832.1 hypothetical protein [Polaromonas sp. CG_9.7]MBG6113833.1 hypothetical protein [Polaromonas sp. CG_9.2]MDH6183750.1 hypothetical protein [Polaromonas sp. CG_23.6]
MPNLLATGDDRAVQGNFLFEAKRKRPTSGHSDPCCTARAQKKCKALNQFFTTRFLSGVSSKAAKNSGGLLDLHAALTYQQFKNPAFAEA